MEWHFVVDNTFLAKTITSFVVVGAILLLRHGAVRSILGHENLDSTVRRRWVVTVRNAAIFFVIFLIVVIWIEQLQAIGAGLVLVAAAVVVATKEFLLNIIGYFYRSACHAFTIGDRIEVNGIHGDVLDQNLMGIRLMEVGSGIRTHQYTGVSVFIPNAIFLSAAVRNETHAGEEYVFHIITITVKAGEDWPHAEALLLEAANAVCTPYLEKARARMHTISRRHALDAPAVEPRINLQMPDHEKIAFQLRVPVPARRRGRIEADILRLYLTAQFGGSGEEEISHGLSGLVPAPFGKRED
ncbi:mechanosensitive ion channel family protein [Desulfobotulus sp. H1]|uniref:Mechanosensitive ion channel family protein n=1 Tax=Desulfobotulus pelophilus TaxID=2823377 RepID=A0ABT3N6D6_9BACT|nr:mechanosensitive ion channel family protein [Desulfobotulus pelophilus]MCW7753024.1 mechanosensitive ion channel family protein [Desulfobotulus pelophilus]